MLFLRRRFVLPWVWVAAWAVAAVPAIGDDEVETVMSGHQRMVAELETISKTSLTDNPYFGRDRAEMVRAELESLPVDAPADRRWLLNILLAKDELRLGRNESAIHHYLEAKRHAVAARNSISRDDVLRTYYELGVAHMRLAESENCVARHTSDSCLLPIRKEAVYTEQNSAIKASKYFLQVCNLAGPSSSYWIRSRWLLNLVGMNLGTYPEGVPEHLRIEASEYRSKIAFPRFRDVAPAKGLNSFDVAGGVIAEDFDGDGRLDLMVSTSDTSGQLRLWIQRDDGGYDEKTREANLSGMLGGLNMMQTDFNNDGRPDVFVLRGAWWDKLGRHPNSLLRNDGNGRFTDVTFESGLGDVHYPTQTAAWADYDNDGDLDVYIGTESGRTKWPGQLFRNSGDGKFVDVTREAGVENYRFAKAVAWGDYDGDRDPDLYVSNLGAPNRLYRNKGDGTFEDVAAELGVAEPMSSFSTWFWDYDNDGALDLFVSAYGGKRSGPNLADVAASYMGLKFRADLPHLYRGDGKGKFLRVPPETGLDRPSLPMGANYGDLDNDGYPEIYLGTGYPQYEALMPNVMYLNRGGKGFADITEAGGFGHLQKGHGIAFADLDDDGDQDVYAQMGGMFPGDAFGNALFENPGPSAKWVKLSLIGAKSNRAAIGARIRVVILEDGKRRTVHDVVSTGGSFGAGPLRREIGLGQAERIESLEVFWPTTGKTQRFKDVPLESWIQIREGDKRFRIRSPGSASDSDSSNGSS